ncbi:HAD family phosphatase [Oscillospiraceae bacterium 44-34]
MTIKGIIFDMDGLMFDTERLVSQAWSQVDREMGLGMSERMPDMMGVSVRQANLMFKAWFGEDFDYFEARRRRVAIVEEEIAQNGLPVKSGLYELLEYLERKKLPMAVATSSDQRVAERYLNLSGVRKYFAAVVCGDMVERSKPDPQIFQTAAALLGTRPGETVVLEDSFHGIHGAFGGGFLPCMVPDLRQPTPDLRRLLVRQFDSLLDVIPFIEETQGRTVS